MPDAPGPLLVFDKDGVLVDTEPIKLRLYNRLFDGSPEQQRAIAAFNQQSVGMAREEKIERILKEILKVEDTGREAQLRHFMDKARELLEDDLLAAPAVPGVEAFIKNSPEPKFLCSIALRTEVESQVSHMGLENYFLEIYAFPARKTEVLRELRERYGRPVVFWGDTLLDYQAACEADCGFIAVETDHVRRPFASMDVPKIPDFTDFEKVRKLAWSIAR